MFTKDKLVVFPARLHVQTTKNRIGRIASFFYSQKFSEQKVFNEIEANQRCAKTTLSLFYRISCLLSDNLPKVWKIFVIETTFEWKIRCILSK